MSVSQKVQGQSLHNAKDHASAAMSLWNPPSSTFDDAFLHDKTELDAKATDAARNNPMIQGGIRSQISQTVGDHFRMSYDVSMERLVAMGWSADQAIKFIDQVEDMFEQDWQSHENWFDTSGRMNGSEMCGCGMYSHYKQGEVISTSEFDKRNRDNGNRPFATSFQMINPERVFTPPFVMENRNTRAGFKRTNKNYAYGMYVFNRHPTEWSINRKHNDSFAYITRHTPFGRPKWLHIMETEGVDQTRGRSALIAALRKERMLTKFEDTMLSNAITRAFYAAVIESEDPKTAFEGMILSHDSDAIEARTASTLAELQQRAAYYSDENQLILNDSQIAHTYPGDTVKLLTPDGHVDFMDPFVAVFMRHLARSLGLSYEEFTGDYTKTNYSGARAGRLTSEAERRMYCARVPAKQAKFMAANWLEEMFATGRVSAIPGATPRARSELFYKFRAELTRFSFYGPGVGHIDPVKGTEAAINEMLMGALTLKEYINRFGSESYMKTLNQRGKELVQAEALGMDLHRMLGVQPEIQPGAFGQPPQG